MKHHLEIQGLRKDYPIFSGLSDRLKAAFSCGLWLPARRFVALESLDLSLTTEDTGQIVGVVGPNGAGKSTLLRILSGVSRPGRGKIQFSGSIRSILELGVGFNAELSAVQNIEHNGILWNYSRTTLRQSAQSILDFAGLRDYAHQPLKTYSTGMQMRLAFALATLERSDLLLVDEALAVGDARFQQKCLDRFRLFRDQGSIILIVSHDMNLLKGICDRMILLSHGALLADGDPVEISRQYLDLIAGAPAGISATEADLTLAPTESRATESDPSAQGLSSTVTLLNKNGQSVNRYHSGDSATILIELESPVDLEDLTCGIHIDTATGSLAFGTNSHLLGSPFSVRANRKLQIRYSLKMNLGPGKYSLGHSLHRGRSHTTDCYIWSHVSATFEVEASPDLMFEGQSNLEPQFETFSL
ncbi:MAG: ABC transporter ATP-binding protein [Leptospiraceae bacterium]|nr:ABC transporter ATP-binding protein [Leptospiraceae bacterium]